jgi:hypothetical protein
MQADSNAQTQACRTRGFAHRALPGPRA